MKTFCEHCYQSVDYTVKSVNLNKTIKGGNYKFIGQEATCNLCGNKINVSSVSDYNLSILNDIYRKSNNLITVDDIKAILSKYNIGKRPLSLALGWGEHTINRYLNGDIPNKKYSDILNTILVDPEELYLYLNKNKDLITLSAYSKAEKEIMKELSIDIDIDSKIENVIYYILSKSNDITPLALQKLLYYVDGFSQVLINTKIFPKNCKAWVHGPVYPDVYHKFKDYGYNPIERTHPSKLELNLNSNEKELIDTVVNTFGAYSGKILEKMTHLENPWIVSRNNLDNKFPSNNLIDNNLIIWYFSYIKNEYKINNINDISYYSRDLFEKVYPFDF